MRPVPASVAAARRLSRQGVAATEACEWEKAESLFRAAVDKSPDEAEPRRQLAESLWRRGAAAEAVEQIVAAADLASEDAQLAVRAGEMLLATGRAHEAADFAQDALQLDNQLALAWALRGRTFAARGQDDRALADFSRALLLEPRATEVLLDSARIYSRRENHDRSLATLHQALDSVPLESVPQELLVLEGRSYLALERPAQAAERLTLAADRGPATVELRMLQAEAELAQGHLPTAENFARLALAIDAENQAAHQMLQQLAGRSENVVR